MLFERSSEMYRGWPSRKIGTVDIPEIRQFVVADKFRQGETVDGIKVYLLGDVFKRRFLSKIENIISAETLIVDWAYEFLGDSEFIGYCGREKIEITVGQLWEFLKTADRNFRHVAYIKDNNGVLTVVTAKHYDDGWEFNALSLDPYSGHRCSRFLSRRWVDTSLFDW